MAKRRSERIVMYKRPPYETAGDYIESKAMTDAIVGAYSGGDDISGNHVSIANYFAKKKLVKLDKLLRTKRKHGVDMRKYLDEQWVQLAQKEEDFRKMFINFDHFIAENDEKRVRAQENIEDSKQQMVKREEQTKELQEACVNIEEVMIRMRKEIKNNRMYEEYLNGMVTMYSNMFNNIYEVVGRYEVIKHAENELMDHLRVALDILEKAKHELTKTVNGYFVTVASLKAQLSLLRQRHEAATRESQRWEETCEKLRAAATDRVVEVVYVKEAARRMYEEICRRQGVKPTPGDCYEVQFDVIKKALRDYRRINEMARQADAQRVFESVRALASKVSE